MTSRVLVAFPLPCLATLVLAATAYPADPKPAQADWPRWRGPHADGVADGHNLPIKWSKAESISW